jgi:cytochrome P450
LAFLEKTARRYGPISSFRLLERDSGAELLRELVGDSLITREEPLHKDRRRMLQPAFHKEQIAAYARIMVAASNRMAANWTVGAELDIRSEMRKLTLEIVGAALFGADFTGSAEKLSEVLQRVGKRSRWLAPIFVFLEPLLNVYRRLNPRGRSLFFHKERAELDQILRPVLDRRGRLPRKATAVS